MKPEILVLDQGSPEWLKAKLGVISASNVSKVLAKKGTETRNGYLMELIGQIATGETEEMNAKALDWGKANEDACRAAYEFHTGNPTERAGFIYGKDKRIGCSPDALITGRSKGAEFKCPMTARVHADFLVNDKIKKEYLDQVNFCLYVTGFETWDFASYHPRFKSNMIKVHTIERDPATFARFDECIPEFLEEMDAALAKLCLRFGDQWR